MELVYLLSWMVDTVDFYGKFVGNIQTSSFFKEWTWLNNHFLYVKDLVHHPINSQPTIFISMDGGFGFQEAQIIVIFL